MRPFTGAERAKMKRLTLAATAVLSLLAAGAAAAQSDPPQGSDHGVGRGNPAMTAVRQACSADLQKLCPDLKGPERRQCMQDHAADLSDGCKSAIAAMRQQMQMTPEQKPQR